MNEWSEILGFVGGIVGIIGGTLGIVAWFANRTKDNRAFNKDLYLKELQFPFSECFDCNSPETDNVNFYNVFSLVHLMTEFNRKGNSFKGCESQLFFKLASKHARILKENIGQFFVFNGVLNAEPNTPNIVEEYKKHKILVKSLKKYYSDFYRAIFERI